MLKYRYLYGLLKLKLLWEVEINRKSKVLPFTLWIKLTIFFFKLPLFEELNKRHVIQKRALSRIRAASCHLIHTVLWYIIFSLVTIFTCKLSHQDKVKHWASKSYSKTSATSKVSFYFCYLQTVIVYRCSSSSFIFDSLLPINKKKFKK